MNFNFNFKEGFIIMATITKELFTVMISQVKRSIDSIPVSLKGFILAGLSICFFMTCIGSVLTLTNPAPIWNEDSWKQDYGVIAGETAVIGTTSYFLTRHLGVGILGRILNIPVVLGTKFCYPVTIASTILYGGWKFLKHRSLKKQARQEYESQVALHNQIQTTALILMVTSFIFGVLCVRKYMSIMKPERIAIPHTA